jgi:tetratricopeptide (TPR) repeat protein
LSETKYDAFISYRRSDAGAVARWLRRQLQSFRPPAALRAGREQGLRVYLDTAYERGTSDFYEYNIKPALLASRWLLVVATPAALKRPKGADDWMQREVSDFAGGPNGGNIIAVRAQGEFNDPLPADLNSRFPNIEIVDLRGAGRFSFLNPVRAARLSAEKLKIVAPLLDLAPDEMPLLRREEERRQQSRLGTAAGVTLATLIAVSSLSVFALQSRFRATRALESSMFATGRMVQSVADQLGREGDAKQLRRRLLNESCDLIDKLRSDADREARIRELVTCRIERGYEHEQQEEQELARGKFQQAVDLASDRDARTRTVDAALAIIQAREAMAAYLTRRKDAAETEAELRRLLADAKRLGTVHGKRHEFAAAEGEALGRLGDLFTERGDRTEAARSYDAAAEAVDRAVKASFGDAPAARVAWLMRLHRLAGEQHQEFNDPEGALIRYARAVETKERIESKKITPEIDLETAYAYALIFGLERTRGRKAEATAARAEALAAVQRVMNAKPATAEQNQRAQRIRIWIEQQPEDGQRH